MRISGRRHHRLDQRLYGRHARMVRQGRKEPGLKPEAVARGLEQFRSVLRGRSLKMSKVREAIARKALTYRGHFSVDELVQMLRDSGRQRCPFGNRLPERCR